MKGFVVVLLLLLQCACCVHSARHCRIDRGVNNVVSSAGYIVEPTSQNWPQRDSSSGCCAETYGFIPCSASLVGNLLLLAGYGYLMFVSGSLLTNGCELLLSLLGPGIIGGLILPIVGSFSHAAPILGTGITTDKETTKASKIMVLSIIPLIVVELATVIHSSSGKGIVVLVTCIAAVICLLSYCIYQILNPWIQKRRVAYAKHLHIISSILLAMHLGWGRLLTEDGQLNEEVLKNIFESLDDDHDGYLTMDELRGLLVGLELLDQQTSTAGAINKVMTEFDSSKDRKLSLDEFNVGMASWLRIGTSTVGHSKSNNYAKKFFGNFQLRTKEELDALMIGDEEEVIVVDNPCKIYMKAVMLMLGGAIMTWVLADPLVEAVEKISDSTTIPPFFISFIIMPFATTSSELFSAIPYARRKKKRTASLTYSEIYGAVTMNNTLCVGVFLAVVYIRGLEWEFSVEAFVIVLVVLVMGLLSSFRTTFPLWMSFIAFLFYVSTIAIVYVLNYVLGWP